MHTVAGSHPTANALLFPSCSSINNNSNNNGPLQGRCIAMTQAEMADGDPHMVGLWFLFRSIFLGGFAKTRLWAAN
jgi:hypothetical protein